MGNSIGGLGEYWDLINSKKNLIGGFIWDMKDQGLVKKDKNKNNFYAYGGDFGDYPNDKNFCINGVFSPEGNPNPHAWEVKYIHQSFNFTKIGSDNGTILAINHLNETNLNTYDVKWSVSENGKEIQSGILENTNVKPNSFSEINIPYKKIRFKNENEYWLRISVHEKKDTFWAVKGFEIAKDQLLLRSRSSINNYSSSSKSKLKVEENSSEIKVLGKKYKAKVDKKSGELISFIKNGKEQILSPLKPNFFRPPIDNDLRGASSRDFKKSRKYWEFLNEKLETKSVKVISDTENETKVVVEKWYKDEVKLKLLYHFLSDGKIVVKMDLDAKENLPGLVKFGITLGVSKEYKNTTFYGKGPWENYIDRKRGTEVDEFSFKTNDLFTDYIFPQENGNRSDVRWLQLSENRKNSLKIQGSPSFGFSIWPYSPKNIQEAKHPFDLKKQDFYTLNLHLIQMSVNGTLSETLPKYVIPSGKYSFEFILNAQD
jgi:beta-galactosidase